MLARDLEQQHIILNMKDGSVGIMAFLIVGRGSVLPLGAVWMEPGWWYRGASRAAIEREIAAALPPNSVESWRIMKPGEVPPDRTYRDAWTDTEVGIVHDIKKARDIQRARFRAQRMPRLEKLDRDYTRALAVAQNFNDPAVLSIERERQRLRDAPTDPRIEAATTVTELKAITL